MTRCIWFLAALVWVWPAQAQSLFTLQPESRIWIDGASNVSSFTCEAGPIEGSAQLPDTPIMKAGLADAPALSAPVRLFDCGNGRMNSDLYDALDAKRHPYIEFRLLGAGVSDGWAGEWQRIQVTGEIAIKGAWRTVSLTAEGRRLKNGLYRVRGRAPLKMTDFDVTPPTALLGMVRARDDIVVRFDLTAQECNTDMLAVGDAPAGAVEECLGAP